MEEYKSTYPSDEKLKASTTMTVKNHTDIPVSFENWTCGFVFLIDSVNCQPNSDGAVKAEYVWYDFKAKDMNNNVLATIKGVYYNHNVILSRNNDGTYSLSKE
ncbi:MAG: hypothetical protein PHC95_11010 [Parabacteroides sp.]|nr:hypothetical protein [Parabacteroides sp.]